MTAFDTAWDLVKMPITYDEYPDWFQDLSLEEQNNPRYLYSGGHRDDDFRYFTDKPNVALGIALFGSAIPRVHFPEGMERYSRNPTMRETVPRMKVLDTSMVDENIELHGQPYEAILPSPEISQRLEEIGALTDVPQSRLEENLKQIIDSARFHRKRYEAIRDTGLDDIGMEIGIDLEDYKKSLRQQMPFAFGWWDFGTNASGQLHPAYERLGMEWDPNTLEHEMWFPDIFNTSAGYRGNPYSNRDRLNHVKGALKRLRTGVPGVIEMPKDQRKFYGIAENDGKEHILDRWKN